MPKSKDVVDVLKEEKAKLEERLEAVVKAISALGGGIFGGGKRGRRSYKKSAATRKLLSAKLKASWKARKAKAGKKEE